MKYTIFFINAIKEICMCANIMFVIKNIYGDLCPFEWSSFSSKNTESISVNIFQLHVYVYV